MDFKQLETFVNIVKLKSFSKAAEASFLTQPTVSSHISQLENELGILLIDRDGKESRPTKEGRAFYNYAINILNTRDRAIKSLDVMRSELNGVLEIRTSTIPGEYVIPSIVKKFSENYPSVSFNIKVSDSKKVSEEILDNIGEIGFSGTYFDDGLKYEELVKDSIVVITPMNEKYKKLKEKGLPLSLADIKDEPYIERESGSSTRKTFEDGLDINGYTPRLKSVINVNSIAPIKEYVRLGMGISYLSSASVKEDDGYYIFKLSGVDLSRAFYMVYNKNITLSPIAQEFKKFVLNEFVK